MLDTETKRRIDTARDILVGKVPDPKSQVEQITIALIYKFMDDMDAQIEELGGERSFFGGDFARYGWAKLMHAGLGGQETMNLYAEAIIKMPENPGVPQLFRDIFKNAYLPYRDPETLRMFLKVIDEFSYEHSERLGDAFEYLLSVLGAQGDAGQFRTPRHIIDFIVEIVDPKKDEKILDPACGTAGFLISAYKHVKENTGENGGSALTPEERKRLADNLKGYDISPDMVRLSLVNMYLHDLKDPHIFEYDTLTSEERWDDFADVILANPPFMSPTGGIRPHNRFSVNSRRSEVLFVDYIAEHLTPGGRAGIIVPEGIIFQSQNAHRRLRKMLVEEYLVAVVSLPQGVFNPYAGVKTSILILDRALARRTNHVGFFKIENDGFDLGAQRREIDSNDLPQAKAEILEYLLRQRAGESLDDFEPTLGLIVEKEKVAENGEYNLGGERYRESGIRSQAKWPLVTLGTVVEILDKLRRPITKHDRKPGPYPYYGATGVLDYVEDYLFDEPLVLIGEDGAKWGSNEQSAFPVEGKIWVNNHAHVLRPRRDQILDRLLIEVLNEMDLSPYITGVTVPKLNQAKLRDIQIPLPPLDIQKEIVAEIEGYQKVIDGARAVVDNYRPHIAVDPEWPMVALGEVCERLQYGLSVRLNTEKTGYKTFRMNELVEGKCVDGGEMKYADLSTEEFKKYQLIRGDILFNRTNSFEHVGRTGIFDLNGEYCFASYLIRLSISKGNANPFYINAFMNTERFQSGIKQYATRAIGQSNINAKSLAAYHIPLPTLETQQAIVTEIEAEQAMVESNRKLIKRFEKKIEAVIGWVWGEGETAGAEKE